MTSLQTKTRNLEKIFQVLDEGGGLRSGGAIHKGRKFNRGSLWRGDEDFRFGNREFVGLFRWRQMWVSFVYVDEMASSERASRIDVL